MPKAWYINWVARLVPQKTSRPRTAQRVCRRCCGVETQRYLERREVRPKPFRSSASGDPYTLNQNESNGTSKKFTPNARTSKGMIGTLIQRGAKRPSGKRKRSSSKQSLPRVATTIRTTRSKCVGGLAMPPICSKNGKDRPVATSVRETKRTMKSPERFFLREDCQNKKAPIAHQTTGHSIQRIERSTVTSVFPKPCASKNC